MCSFAAELGRRAPSACADVLREGESLYLPAGWFHFVYTLQVRTHARTKYEHAPMHPRAHTHAHALAGV